MLTSWKTKLLGAVALSSTLGIGFGISAHAQVLDNERKVSVTLTDGTTVVMYCARRKPKECYYLPPYARLSFRPDGVPEFLFMKFTTEASDEDGGINGGLLHMLMEWGLTDEHEAEVQEKLEEKVEGAELKGAVQMHPGADEGAGFQIISATLSDDTLTPVLEKTKNAPLIEGGKVAAAARLNKYGAQLLDSTFAETSSITDLSVTLNMAYETQLPAAKGYVSMDWSKLELNSETFRAEYERKQTGTRRRKSCFMVFCARSSRPTYSRTYEEVKSEFDFLVEKEVIKFVFEENYSDERVNTIRDAFVQVFINMMAEPVADDLPPPPPSEEEKEKTPNIKYGNKYTYNTSAFRTAYSRKSQRFDLNYRLTVRWPFQVTGNLLSWYNTAKDYPGTTGNTILNDPFFEHRDINVLLDLESESMFEDIVSLVDVEIRKKRNQGNDFTDAVTFDRENIKTEGVRRQVTYSRGEDTNSDVYEYKTRWSLRGGAQWPENPKWEKGDWQGISISPPVEARTIELMGDLGELENSGIVRVTAQVRYPQLGDEKEANIQLSPISDEALVSETVFMDRDAEGYAYRLVINHKRHGKLALPWSGRRTDDFIYAVIPEELLAEEPTIIDQAKEAAKEAAGKVVDRVLSEMDNLE